MIVATWNIGGGYVFSKNSNKFDLEDLDYFIDELKKIQPDIVCFQEIHISQNCEQSKKIAKKLGFNFFETKPIANSHLKKEHKLSISIISKYPILSANFFNLLNPNLQFIWNNKKVFTHNKGFIEAIINYKNVKIRILSGHTVPFHLFGRNFLDDEFSEIRNQIETIILQKKIPTIVGADMNFEDVKKLLPNVFLKKFKFVLKNIPTTPQKLKQDKILISNHWELLNSKIVKGESDHYLCYSDVKLKKY